MSFTASSVGTRICIHGRMSPIMSRAHLSPTRLLTTARPSRFTHNMVSIRRPSPAKAPASVRQPSSAHHTHSPSRRALPMWDCHHCHGFCTTAPAATDGTSSEQARPRSTRSTRMVASSLTSTPAPHRRPAISRLLALTSRPTTRQHCRSTCIMAQRPTRATLVSAYSRQSTTPTPSASVHSSITTAPMDGTATSSTSTSTPARTMSHSSSMPTQPMVRQRYI